MLRLLFVLIIFTASLFQTSFSQSPPEYGVASPKIAGGVLMGYNNSFGINFYGSIYDFTYDVPLAIRLGIGYTITDPGSAADARKIFINDATNGVPEKSGHVWDFRLDLTYPINLFSFKKSYIFAGPRIAMFNGNFRFIDGNEFFDIGSTNFGLGGGLETHFGITPKLSFVLTTGVEYYFSNTIEGHDTAYSPDGQNVNPRNEFNYSDADNAINQPKLNFRFLGGLHYYF